MDARPTHEERKEIAKRLRSHIENPGVIREYKESHNKFEYVLMVLCESVLAKGDLVPLFHRLALLIDPDKEKTLSSTVINPCPFCGGEAEVEWEIIDGFADNYLRYIVRCIDCDASVGSHVEPIDEDELMEELQREELRYAAINTWNKRCVTHA